MHSAQKGAVGACERQQELALPLEASDNASRYRPAGQTQRAKAETSKPVKPQNRQRQETAKADTGQAAPKPAQEATVFECLRGACMKLHGKAEAFCGPESRSSETQRLLLRFADQLNGQICRSELGIDEKQQLWQKLETIVDLLK